MDIFQALASVGINRANISGNPMFDYFFTVVIIFGMISFFISALIKIGSRS